MNISIIHLSQSNKKFPSRKSIYIILNKSFDKRLSLSTFHFPGAVKDLDKFINFMIFVKIIPNDFPTIGISSSSKSLLTPIIEKRDSPSNEWKS